MLTDTDLKSLWRRQPQVARPDTKELFERAAKLKVRARNKLLLTNMLLLCTSAYIIYIIHSYHPKMITTILGASLVVIAMVVYLLVYNSMLPLLMKTNLDVSVQQYLDRLIKLKQRQDFLFRTMLSIYFILLSAGIFLYFIEVAAPMSLIPKIITYSATIGWFLFAWFYLRPLTIKKQQAELILLIDKLKSINDQLSVM